MTLPHLSGFDVVQEWDRTPDRACCQCQTERMGNCHVPRCVLFLLLTIRSEVFLDTEVEVTSGW
jgi:hypothetical protein